MHRIETKRMKLRKWDNTDHPSIARFFSDKANARFVGGLKTPEESWRLMAAYIGHYELYGYSYLALADRTSGELIGSIGIWNSEPWPEAELGYWLLPEYQGKGYGQEAGIAVKEYALNALKLSSLVSYIDPANEPSKRLALRIGATFDGTMELLDFGLHEVYRYQ